MVFQAAIEETKDNLALDTYLDIELKWFKFKTQHGIREFILVPKDWNIPDFSGFEFHGTDSDFEFMMKGVSLGDHLEFENETITLIEEKSLSKFVVHEVIERESGEFGSGKPLNLIQFDLKGNILDNLTKVLKEFNNTEQYIEIKKLYHQFHAPFIHSYIIPETEMFEFYLQMFNDSSSRYYIGSELSYNPQANYQISTSSIAYLVSLDLLKILEKYQNVFIEETQKKWIENAFSRNLNSKTCSRIGLTNNADLYLNKNNAEQKKEIIDMYRDVVLAVRKLKINDVGIINQKIKSTFLFDESTIQASIIHEKILLSEDEAIQNIANAEFKIRASSVGILISNYFLEIDKNVERFLDIHIDAINKKMRGS